LRAAAKVIENATQQATAERLAQRQLFEEQLGQAEAERRRRETDLLEAVVAEMKANLVIHNRTTVDRFDVGFELSVMAGATREVGGLDFPLRTWVQEAVFAMRAYNAQLTNFREDVMRMRSTPGGIPLSGIITTELEAAARVALAAIDQAQSRLEQVVNDRRAAEHPSRASAGDAITDD